MERQPDKARGSKPGLAEAKKRKEPPPSGSNASSKDQQNNNKNGKETGAGRALKRAKFHEARAVRSQPSDAALKDGELDLQAFLNAREFEIRALEDSMKKNKAVANLRAFQKVPRSMRRRTASHNAKRVPKRLRAKARWEQAADNTTLVGGAGTRRPRTTRARIRAETAKRLGILADKKRKRALKQQAAAAAAGPGGATSEKQSIHTRPARPKIRRNMLNDPQKPKAKFRKRQINKTWLPTHLWHAKRARMTEPKKPLWRFAIPLTPTEKCYRPTHRAAGDKGAVIWDTSYTSTIGLYGSAEGIERVLKALGATQESLWGPKGRKRRAGCKKWGGMLSKERKGGVRRDIGPATLIWNPEVNVENATEGDTPPVKTDQRQMFIRVHPSSFLELFNELLKLVKMQTPQLYVEDLRFEIGSIELTGPGSVEALLATLQPYHSGEREEQHAAVFKSLAGVTNPASLPMDSLLAFSIMDPRLRYPPKTMLAQDGGGMALLEMLARWPVGDTANKPFGLFDRNARFEAGKLPSQKSVNRRKGTSRPGEAPILTAADPPIPIILLASRPPAGGQVQGTWTLLAPWKCIRPIWYSLVHYPLSSGGNPRFGGLDELRQVAFEQGVPWFPGDFPGTNAGAEWELEQRAKRKADWDRRPRGKKVEWKSLDLGAGRKGEVGSGLACDWECLFGLATDTPQTVTNDTGASSLVDDQSKMDIDSVEAPASNKGRAGSKSQESLELVTQLSKSAVTSLLRPQVTENPPKHSIFTVNLTFVTKGVVTTCARIYRLPKRHEQITNIPSTFAEVPSTEVPSNSPQASLPSDFRDHWLSRLPLKSRDGSTASTRSAGAEKQIPPAPRMPPGTDLATRKRLIAESLLGTQLPYPRPPANQTDVGGHPLCPDEADLIGFVTTGAFCLSEGKGTAIGCISADKALEGLREAGSKAKEGRLCVVRNAGESIGWLARWEPV